ncbi:Phagocyte signaling-impaired protein [Papilio xuthus]|uniref:N-terminal acetyltransferase B complex subunit MDM20 homolog n=1 Tax=Papilio xuthus TaxID=66420 RepID=A0A194Q1A4_PAPXU|nr:Phagocyte signaling-impaired protein [Papilio xuthus]
MAVRPQHMHDGGIVERRLRPIYDWLDNGVNKKALQEAEKVLKKSPTLQAARALKALALLRLGKKCEAQAVLEALAEEKPSDDTTLQAMTISYRESQQLQKVCEAYEAAVRAEPSSEELHSHLFMAYVRVGDHRAQHRAALQLYRIAPKNPYYFWAVMSIVLQAKSTEDVSKKSILLALAQRMVDNFIMENKMEAEQEARLYMMILELQEKWEDLLAFVEGPVYAQLVPGSMLQASIPYLRRLGRWRRLNLVCKDLLWENQDRWDYYMPYFDSVFELMKGAECDESEGSADDTAEKCHEFICSLVESVSAGRALRGPYLARLELWRRLAAHEAGGEAAALLGSARALCVQYLRVFAAKPCAVADLRPYLAIIPQQEREDHCRDFLTCLDFDENSEPDNAADIQRHVSCLCAWRLCAPPPDAADSLALADALRAHYLRCVGAAPAPTPPAPTDASPADAYATLAAHHYCYAAVQRHEAGPLVQALGVLELCARRSPAQPHAKLLLLALYHMLGAGSAADAAFARLEAKHVQLASLGWLHAARLPAAAPALAAARLADVHTFYQHHAKDSVEQLTYAYKYGTFEKLVELGAWRARLEACAWAALAARERALLQPPAPPAGPPIPPALPDALTDNRDLSVIVSWEPAQRRDAELRARTFERDVAYLRLKDALVRALALCAEAAAAHDNTHLLRQLDVCVDAFDAAMERCRREYRTPEEDLSVSAPLPSRIFALVQSPASYGALYTRLLRVARAACERGEGEGGAGAVGRAAAALSAALRAARPALAHLAPASLWHTRDALEQLSNVLEFAGVMTYVMGVCREVVTPTNSRKASKKKASVSPERAATGPALGEAGGEAAALLGEVRARLEAWPAAWAAPHLASGVEDRLAGEYRCPVAGQLERSYREALRHARDTLDDKIKYLKSMQ